MNSFTSSIGRVFSRTFLYFVLMLPISAWANSIDVFPTKNTGILMNPDIGIVDHQTINIKDNIYRNIPTYPETSVVYYRWYWEELEPEEGKYNFQLIDEVFQEAESLNKKVVIRFMTLSGKGETYYAGNSLQYKKILGIPCWVKKKLNPDIHDVCADNNSYVVDYNNAKFQAYLSKFLQAMGQRYNNNPNLLRLDVGVVGTWGEWHLYSHAPESSSTLGANGYSEEDLQIYINMMKDAFPDKTLTIDLGTSDDDFVGVATAQGLGWRADCVGDWAPEWNHMENAYPQTLSHIEKTIDPLIHARWKTAPVDFEICYTMQDWANQPEIYTIEKVKETFNFALSHHVSLFNLKSGEIPNVYQPALKEFRKKIGYRFFINSVSVQGAFSPNGRISIISKWTNEGVAPSYINYPVVWRLVDGKGTVISYFDTNNDITEWLPAEDLYGKVNVYTQSNEFHLPSNIKPGKYSLEVGLINEHTRKAMIQLAINNQSKDNWYHILILEVK